MPTIPVIATFATGFMPTVFVSTTLYVVVLPSAAATVTAIAAAVVASTAMTTTVITTTAALIVLGNRWKGQEQEHREKPEENLSHKISLFYK